MSSPIKVGFFVTILMSLCVSKAVASCEVSVSPSNVVMGTASTSRFTVRNTGDGLGNWVRIQSPGLSAFSIAQMSANGWYTNGNGTEANFTGGYLESGTSANFDVILAETGVDIDNMSWEALVSYDAGGSFESCGSANIQVDREIVPSIGDVSIVVGANSATIAWKTNVNAKGVVEYGLDTSYGGRVENSNLSTTHEIVVVDLIPEMTYHYRLTSVSATGVSGSTNDLNFKTGIAGITTTVTNTVNTTVTKTLTNTTTATVTKLLTDTTPPSLKIDQLPRKVYESAPIISGLVMDNRGTAKIEYSISDNANDWNLIEIGQDIGGKKFRFELTPNLTLDGTYVLKIRAIDVFGNVSKAERVEFVIDAMPPTVGGSVISYGAIPLHSNHGITEVIADIDYEVLLYEMGGSDSVSIMIEDKNYQLQKLKTQGVWRGVVRFEDKGKTSTVTTTVRAVDGAGKKTERSWINFRILPKGKILEKGNLVSGSSISLWSLDVSTKKYKQWNGGEYGMTPSSSWSDHGYWGYVVPPGDYYLLVKRGDRRYFSQRIRTEHVGNLVGDMELNSLNWYERIIGAKRQIVIASEIAGLDGQDNPSLSSFRERWIGEKTLVYFGSKYLPWDSLMRSKALEWSKRENAKLLSIDLFDEAVADSRNLDKIKIGLSPQVYLINDKGDTIDYKVGIWER